MSALGVERLRPLWPLVVFAAVSLGYVVADAYDVGPAATVLKAGIVGSLLVWVLLATGGRPPRLLLVGLVFALLGDVLLALPGTPTFLAGMGAFLVMQLCYIAGFLGLGARSRLRPAAVAGWAALWLVLNLALGPLLGAMRWPMAAYSVALIAMAACAVATGSRAIGVGGLLFLVSDLLIAVRAADIDLPASGLLVMATYCTAQLLIAAGWVDRERPTAVGPSGAGARAAAGG